MKKIYTLFALITICNFSFGQVVFQSNLSTWAGGVPVDWMGSKSSITSSNVSEQVTNVVYGDSKAALTNPTSLHKRFTTQVVSVTPGESYEIEMWVNAQVGLIRTGFYDNSNADYGDYNGYLDLSESSAGTLVQISQILTVPAGCTSVEFILSIKETDANAILIDSVAISVTTPPPPPAFVSIYDIQHTTNLDGISPELDNTVTTAGIVTGIFQIGNYPGSFFIQDGDGAWNGIYVFETGTSVNLGDSVVVAGKVSEYFSLTEITDVSSITIISSGNPMPEATLVTSTTVGNEEYEGVLVQITDGINTDIREYGVWTINDGNGDVFIDDDLLSATYTPDIGNYYNVVGVRHLSFGDILVLPRDEANDIITVGYASVEEKNLDVSIYPNPATTNVTISGIENGTVTIYAVSGEVVYDSNVNGTVSINTEDLTTGVYMIEVIENNVKANYKFIVK